MFLKPSMFSDVARAIPRAVVTGVGTSELKVWTIEKGKTTLIARTTPDLTTYSITSATTTYPAYWDGNYFFIAVRDSVTAVNTVILRSKDGITWEIVHDFAETQAGRFVSDGDKYVHYSFRGTTADDIDFIQSIDGGTTFSDVAEVSPHGQYAASYPNGDLLCYPNDSTAGIHYFARRSKVDQSLIVRYPAAAPLSILSGNWGYWKKRLSFFGDQAFGAGIYEINADLLTNSVLRRSPVGANVFGIIPSVSVGQTGTRLFIIDYTISPTTWKIWYTDDGTTWTEIDTWVTSGSIDFPFYGSQSKNRVGLASNIGSVRISWDNGATFNTISTGSAQRTTICI